MNMIPCESSQISAYGYDPEAQVLAIQFKRGGNTYHYADVPEDIFTGLQEAESVGSYFAKEIKNGGFKYEKQEPPETE